MVGKGMRGWSRFDKGNGMLCRRNSKYEVLRWKQLGIFLEEQESQTGWSTARKERHSEQEEHSEGGGAQ